MAARGRAAIFLVPGSGFAAGSCRLLWLHRLPLAHFLCRCAPDRLSDAFPLKYFCACDSGLSTLAGFALNAIFLRWVLMPVSSSASSLATVPQLTGRPDG